MNSKFILFSVGIAASFFQLNAQEISSRLESKAKDYLTSQGNKIGKAEAADLKLFNSTVDETGEILRFDQYVGQVPVLQGDIVIHYNKADQVTFIAESAFTKSLSSVNTDPSISAVVALEKAKSISKINAPEYEENKLYVFQAESGSTHLVYRIVLISNENIGEWETLVDAHTGEILRNQDISNYYTHKNSKLVDNCLEEEPKKASGTGYVYDPDPLSKVKATYAGQYVDNNDATNASLDAARSLVTLNDIEFANNVYKLKSTYAEIVDVESPKNGLYTQSSPDFLFNRFEDGFEAVNVFYHVDKSMRYINETLGIACKPTLNSGRVKFDPHGLSGDDNSHYVLASQLIAFGEGGVDDGEDADVIIHELGHGIHHWITGLKSSSSQGLGEGSGDYWAQSYSRSLNQWSSTDPQYHWTFSWDGHNEFWAGRTTNYAKKYNQLTNSIHTDGQIWSTFLMRIYDQLGRDKTDRIFLKGLALTNSSANQQTAATAVRTAALNMVGTHGFTCADVALINSEMTITGYATSTYTCSATLANSEVKKQKISIYPNPAKEYVNLNRQTKASSVAKITTADGRLVKEIKITDNQTKIDVSGLAKGLYLITVDGESQKLIKE